jgi:hypothetical protein
MFIIRILHFGGCKKKQTVVRLLAVRKIVHEETKLSMGSVHHDIEVTTK